jgi:hypothetical protein
MRWPCRGRRPRVNRTLHRWFATDMSPLWGFEDAGAGMLGYRYVAPLGLCRHVCAERIVAQRASILVASRRPRKTRWPCRGRRLRVNKTLHRCFATNMSLLWGFEDAGAAMSGYRYVAPLGLWRRWRGDVWLPICRPSGALPARMCRADCGPAGQYIGSKPATKKNALAL